mmetsp:Transcript_23844/g.56294  ORF Transcript_23844/g.56294 Transcript_23844/m.56294 type:complete len:470 (+) Transcript_23844:70-1479(+)
MATTMVAQQHHAPAEAAGNGASDHQHDDDDDDVFDRVFTSFEATVLPYILTTTEGNSHNAFLEDDDGAAPILDYVCENVEQFACRDDAPHLLLEEQVANALGVGGVSSKKEPDTEFQHHQYSIDRDNSLVEQDLSAGTPVVMMMPTTSEPMKSRSTIASVSSSLSGSSTSSARAARGFRAKSRIKIQPCGAEGDVLDYVFEETVERHTCGAATGTGVSPSTTTRDAAAAPPPPAAAARIEQEEGENQQGGGSGDPPGMVLCGDHGGVVAAASAAAAAATSPCWVTTGSTSTSTPESNKKHTRHLIQPCGTEGDVLDYTFEQTETFTCGEQSVPTGRETTMPLPPVPGACVGSSGGGGGGGGDDHRTTKAGDGSRHRRRRGEHKELMGIETQRFTVEPTTPPRRRKKGILSKLSGAAATAAAAAASSKRFSSSNSSRRRTIKTKKSQDSVDSSASTSSEEIQLFFRPQRS